MKLRRKGKVHFLTAKVTNFDVYSPVCEDKFPTETRREVSRRRFSDKIWKGTLFACFFLGQMRSSREGLNLLGPFLGTKFHSALSRVIVIHGGQIRSMIHGDRSLERIERNCFPLIAPLIDARQFRKFLETIVRIIASLISKFHVAIAILQEFWKFKFKSD